MKRTVLSVALAGVLLGAGALAATAATAPPAPVFPPGVSGPTATATLPEAPTYVVTPGVGGSDLPAPGKPPTSAPTTLAPATTSPNAPRTTAPPSSSATPSATPTSSPSPVGDYPTAIVGLTAPDSEQSAWWLIGPGVLLVLVLVVLAAGFVRRQRADSGGA